MKRIFFLLLVLFINYTNSQELQTRELLAPESRSYDDLEFLKEELKDKRLIMLGETTHYFGNIFEMKTRVIEFLHEEMDYNTIAMEASLYDIWKKTQNGPISADDFNDAVYGVWGNSLEFQRLDQYIVANNLKVIGFDSQIGNSSAFIDDFFDYVEDNHLKLKLDEEDLGIVMEGILEDFKFEEYDIKFKDFEAEIQRIIAKIESSKPSEQNYHWAQVTKGLLATARDAYYHPEAILSYEFVNKQHNIRDAQMADNILTYMAQYPDEKVVVWADNIHVMNSMESITKPVVKEFVPMGSHIKKALGTAVYSLGTLHANDSLSHKTGVWDKTPIQNPSIEYELKALKKPFLFVSSNQAEMRKTKQHRLLSYLNFMEGRLDQFHDGYIFFNHATLSTPNIPKAGEEEKIEGIEPTIATSKPESRKIDDVTYFKGKILDAETNQPVSYANLIMKNEAVYRVADEEGHFEFPQYKDTPKNAIISVSSMGYVTQNIPLNQLNATIILKHSLETLAEVTITARRSAKSVLRETVKKIKINHPTTPFNYSRYSNVLLIQNDETQLNLDIITEEYDQGYRQFNRLTQRVTQIKWNRNLLGERLISTHQLFFFRQNAIRYANVLHKRKYKKFDVNFIKSDKPEDEGLYIIAFKTDRDNWNYTNRSYPTTYKGKIYINKADLAIVKVIENRETTLNKKDIENYKDQNVLRYAKNFNELKLKEVDVYEYSKMEDGKYYATRFYRQDYTDFKDASNKIGNKVYIYNSSLYDLKTENVEAIDYDYYQRNETLLRRVDYDEAFWNSFQNEAYLKFNN